MPKFHPISLVLLSCAIAPFLQAASQLDEPTYDDNVYVNCQYRVAAIFPRAPAIRDFTYTNGGRSVPAREFYIQQGADKFSVIVADFSNGPAVDEKLIDNAAAPLRQRGEIRFQFAAVYDPGIPGRQLNIFQPNGRQLRASVYMADHRLYITEADSVPGDFAALQFEQSVSLINAQGTDLDKNGNLPSRQYNCKK
jgi:hypothetical protein